MGDLRRRDFENAFAFLRAVSDGPLEASSFARRAVAALPRLVASEVTTLSVCDLATGRRRVVGDPSTAISARELEVFDHYFFEHPLVLYHSRGPDGVTHRISDSLARAAFTRTPLYNEYYRVIGIDCAVAVPLLMDGAQLVSLVLNRSRRDFADRDCELLELVRPPLAALYRRGETPPPLGLIPLTPREREVLEWVARGKTSRDIGRIFAMSPRTVEKHLEHIYEKLGVETRTAAVLRALRR